MVGPLGQVGGGSFQDQGRPELGLEGVPAWALGRVPGHFWLSQKQGTTGISGGRGVVKAAKWGVTALVLRSAVRSCGVVKVLLVGGDVDHGPEVTVPGTRWEGGAPRLCGPGAPFTPPAWLTFG